MSALVKTKAKNLKVPLPEGDIDDIVTDSTCRLMARLKQLPDISVSVISKEFWFQNLSAFRDYNRSMEPDATLRKALSECNKFIKIIPRSV